MTGEDTNVNENDSTRESGSPAVSEELEPAAEQHALPAELSQLEGPHAAALPMGDVAASDLDLTAVLDIPVELTAEIGRTRMTIREALAIGPGSIVSLERAAGEPVDLLANGRLIARGEVIAIDEEYGLRITEVLAPALPGADAP